MLEPSKMQLKGRLNHLFPRVKGTQDVKKPRSVARGAALKYDQTGSAGLSSNWS